LRTNKGDIVVRLFPDHAPATVQNFVGLARAPRSGPTRGRASSGPIPLYDGTGFHRVISRLHDPGRRPARHRHRRPGLTFKDEFHPELSFDQPYLLAMANSGPATNGSQFFVTVQPTPWLNFKHTIFGAVEDTDSQAVVDAIASARTARGDKPVDPIVIESVAIERRAHLTA
jgi:peptidyl-prolyl cis-trans isomerase A (cyclophilin A)